MSRIKGLYSVNKVDNTIAPFPRDAGSGCRVETQSGTVYWLGAPDGEGFRDILREPRQDNVSSTMVMQSPTARQKSTAIRNRFRGRLRTDVEAGVSLAIEVRGLETRILSEVVVSIEPQDVPDELFR